MSSPAEGDRPLADLQFSPCSQEDLLMVLGSSLLLLDEFQKDSALDLSMIRRAIIGQAAREIREYTKLSLDGRTVGWYHLVERPAFLELDDVNILEAFRSLGYGSKLLDRVRAMAQEKQKPLCVTVTADNIRAQRFYERNGFRFSHQDAQKHLVFILSQDPGHSLDRK